MLSPRLRCLSALVLVTSVVACASSDDDASPASAHGTPTPNASQPGDDASKRAPDRGGVVSQGKGGSGAGGKPSGSPAGGSSAGGGTSFGSAGGAGSSSQGVGNEAPPPNLPVPPKEKPVAIACETLDPTVAATFYLSADDSNSMASPVMARHILRKGGSVSGGYIRTYEFLNYYNVAFEPPVEGSLRIVPELRDGEEPGTVSLQIGVQSALSAGPRRPITMTFVLDNSGSMAGAPIENQRASMRAIAKKLQPGDIVSVVTWNTANRVELSGHEITGPDDPTLLGIIAKVNASGGTDVNGGLTAGYELAQKHFGENRINRVVVISDGIANAGVTEKEIIGKHADDNNKQGIYLVGIAVGEGFNDTLLNVVTDAGNGAYLYVDSAEEATKMLTDRFDETFAVAARDVRVRADFPWYFQIKEFFGEEYSKDPTKVKPQHLAPGDAMVFNQVLSGCAGAKLEDADVFSFSATWGDPISFEEKSVSLSMTLGELRQGRTQELHKGEAIVAYAEALKLSGAARTAAVADAQAKVAAADPAGTDVALGEIKELLGLVKLPDSDAPPRREQDAGVAPASRRRPWTLRA